jgi:hypothetical protein
MTRTKKNDNTNTKKYSISTSILKNAKSNISKSTRKYKSINFTNIKYNINDKNKLTQKGGNIFKHWKNMYKFKKFKKNFDSEEAKIKKYIGSYKINSETFKKIAESKRDSTTNYILNKRQLTILDMTKPKETSTDKTDKNFLKGVISGHDLSMIENKTKRLELEMSETNRQIAKNLPEFIKDKKQFQIRTTKFIKLVEKFSDTDIGKFNAKIKLKKLRYNEITKQTNTTLKSTDKKDKKKYTKHKADYDAIAKFGDDVIQNQQKLVHEINELLQNAEFYIGQMEALVGTKTGADANIIEWDKLYRKIFEFLYKIIGNIGKTKGKIEEVKKLELEIDMSLHPIAQTRSDKTAEERQLKESSRTLKNSQEELTKVIQFLDASAGNLNEILAKLINEKMASELYLDTTKIASTFEYIYNIMVRYMNIFKPIATQSGGANGTVARGRGRGGRGGRGRGGRGGTTFRGTPNIGIKSLHPICYNSGDPDRDFNEIAKTLITPNDKNTTLFIYTDSFKNYSQGNVADDGNGIITEPNFTLRKFRKDVAGHNISGNKINSLGIPVGFDDKDQYENDTLDINVPGIIENIINTPIPIDKNSININFITKHNNQVTVTDALNLFSDAIKNIHLYINKFNIKTIYYYAYCNDNNINDKYVIDMKPFYKSAYTFSQKNFFKKSADIRDKIKALFEKDGFTENTVIAAATPTGAAPTGAAPTGAAPTGAAPTGAAPTVATPTVATPVVAPVVPPYTKYSIHPLNNKYFENIFVANKNKDPNYVKKMLFIYNENFIEYASDTIEKGGGNARARPFRQDLIDIDDNDRIEEADGVFKQCDGMMSIGIPTGYLIDDATISNDNINNNNYDYNNLKFRYINEDDTNLKQYYEFATIDGQSNKLFEMSLQNIYKFIIDHPDITDIYYSADTTNNYGNVNYPDLGLKIFSSSAKHPWTHTNLLNINNQLKNLFEELGKISGRKFEKQMDSTIINTTPIQGQPVTATVVATPAQAAQATRVAQAVAQAAASRSTIPTTVPQITQINASGFAMNSNSLITIPSNNNTITDDSGNVIKRETTNITINGQIATITKDGHIFFDQSLPLNSPIHRIVKNLKLINTQNQYNNNIEKISKNIELIYDIFNGITTPQSEFMSISKDVQELSQELIKLKFIEPKLIKANIGSPSPLAKKYSWVLKPVELIKSELHSLKGTETLNKLINENKGMQEIISKNSQVSDEQYKILITMLELTPSLKPEYASILDKIVESDSNINILNKKIKDQIPDITKRCTVYRNIIYSYGTRGGAKFAKELLEYRCNQPGAKQAQYPPNQNPNPNKKGQKGYPNPQYNPPYNPQYQQPYNPQYQQPYQPQYLVQ